jgi:hypothetical protein
MFKREYRNSGQRYKRSTYRWTEINSEGFGSEQSNLEEIW